MRETKERKKVLNLNFDIIFPSLSFHFRILSLIRRQIFLSSGKFPAITNLVTSININIKELASINYINCCHKKIIEINANISDGSIKIIQKKTLNEKRSPALYETGTVQYWYNIFFLKNIL